MEISGLTPELERNVRAYLSIAQQMGTEAEPLAENRIRRLDNQAPDQIRAALQPFGYYDPTIHSSIRHEKDKWIVRYDIDPGKPTVLTVVDISMQGGGRDSKSVRDAFASIMIKPGDVLNQQRYEAAKQRLSQAAYNAGYIDASYTRSQILVRPKAHEAEIHLNFDTGPRYYFGNITVQQDILNPHFVAQFVPIKPGDPFATDRLLALQQSLDNSGYFSSVIVDVKRDQTLNQRIPIVVRTEPRKTQDYTLGFGYGTDTGPRLSLGVELRRLNRRGHSFTANLRLSSIEQTATGEYRIPVQDVSRDFLAFSTSLGAQTIGDWNTRQLLLGMSWQDQWWGVTRRIYFTAQRERYWTAAITEPTTRELFFPGIQLTEQQADDPIYPRHASSWSLDLRGGSEALGSDASFERLYMVVKLVRPLGKRVRYLLRGEYGAIRTSDFASLPPSQRFYAGGEGSVRGYTYQSLSSSGPAGDSLGGRYLLDGSAELDVLIVGDYGAAVFYDVGNAGNDPWPSLKHGAGVGLRWKSPVGMIGIDFAHPFDEPGTSVRVHLSIGGEL
ncbi:MAG TPA: autotransporter assembly complex family protein [Gammaproteobacteria bacterium]|nr:autotransporter assembly complex family protein [Gammaproteobacteria bacterium]